MKIDKIAHLHKLKVLNLSNNKISILNGLDGSRDLEILNISNNFISKIDFIPSLPKVSYE